jgi:hypothetical protein
VSERTSLTFTQLYFSQTNRRVHASTSQEKISNRAATEAFDCLLEIAQSEFWNRAESIEADSSEFCDLLDARLLVISTLAHQAHVDYNLQRQAEQRGIFDILFAILDKNYKTWLPSFECACARVASHSSAALDSSVSPGQHQRFSKFANVPKP